MRKGVYGRQLGRNKNQRKALFRGLICSLFEKGEIVTTLAKAKAIKSQAEKLITKAIKGSLNDRRIILRFLTKRSLVDRLVDGIAPVLGKRQGGYLKIMKIESRRGDNASVAQISFVDKFSVVEKPKKESVKKVKGTVKKKEDKNDKTD